MILVVTTVLVVTGPQFLLNCVRTSIVVIVAAIGVTAVIDVAVVFGVHHVDGGWSLSVVSWFQ